jgi:hypothetical protein
MYTINKVHHRLGHREKQRIHFGYTSFGVSNLKCGEGYFHVIEVWRWLLATSFGGKRNIFINVHWKARSSTNRTSLSDKIRRFAHEVRM